MDVWCLLRMTIAQRFNAGSSEGKQTSPTRDERSAPQDTTVLPSLQGLRILLSLKPSVETLDIVSRVNR